MNPDIKKKWVKALRSGKYKQGREYLKTDEGYCCLGVLCDIYIKEHGELWEDPEKLYDHQAVKGVKECMGSMDTLPRGIRKWAGLNSDNPFVSFGDKILGIGDWNDGSFGISRKSFKEIADAIEEQL